MRTDRYGVLADHAIQYIRTLCNEAHHDHVTVFTEVGRLCNVELNRMNGLDPARNYDE